MDPDSIIQINFDTFIKDRDLKEFKNIYKILLF